MTSDNWERDEIVDEFVPAWRVELGSRVLRVIEMFGTKAEAAKVAGVRVEQLGNYTAGKAKVPFEVLTRLASKQGVSLDWLATGEGEMKRERVAPPPLNRRLLEIAIRDAEELLAAAGRELDPPHKARFIAVIYGIGLDNGALPSRDTLYALLGLAQPQD